MTLSRRGFLQSACAVPLAAGYGHAFQVENGDHPVKALAIRMVKQFKHAYVLDVSADGKNICLYYGSTLQSYTWRGGFWRRDGEDPGKIPLQVVHVGSWATSFSTDLHQRPLDASFFPDGTGLYVETEGSKTANGFASQQLLIDLRSGKVEEKLRYESPGEPAPYYSPVLPNGQLLGVELRRKQGYRALLRSSVPDYTELQRVDVSPREEIGRITDIRVSADRMVLVYAVDHSIVCRRTDDLSVMWQRAVEPNLRVSRVAISPDGSRIAVAAVNTQFVEGQHEYYVALLSGKDGSVVSKLPLNGDVGIEISPDGKLLAVSQRKPNDKPQKIQPTVRIYDFASGQVVAAATHDAVSTREGYIWGILRSRFTPDGKYLLTYGDADTRVWEIG